MILAATIATGCMEEAPEFSAKKQLSVIPSMETHMNVATRAAVESSSFPVSRSFIMSATYSNNPQGRPQEYFSNALFSNSPEGWTNGDINWPSEGTLDLLAISCGELAISDIDNGTDVSESTSFTVPDNHSTQEDILYAVKKNASPSDNALSFRHAQALLVFTASNTVERDKVNNRGITINDISLNGTFFDGALTIKDDNTIELDCSESTEGSMDASLPMTDYDVPTTAIDTDSDTYKYGIGGQGLLVFPQERTSITVTYTVFNETKQTTKSETINLSDNWEANKKYTFVLNFDGDRLCSDIAIYEISINKTALAYDYTGTYGPSRSLSVTSTKRINGKESPAAWKTQVKDNGVWKDLSTVIGTSTYSWLGNLNLSETKPASATTSLSTTLSASPIISHENVLKENKLYQSDGETVYDNSSSERALDLSRYDFMTRSQESTRYTAICYVISSPGWYKFPLVYGNAIENDATVTLSYDPTSAGLGHLDGFKNYKYNINISDPWIENDWKTYLINKNQIASLKILWERFSTYDTSTESVITTGTSAPGASSAVVENLSIITESDGRYARFYINPNKIRPGNFLVAAMDAGSDADDEEGETGALVMWSWHIWITDQPMNTVTVNNGTQSYNILPVNVGWTDGTKGQFHKGRTATIRFASIEEPETVSDELTINQTESWDESTTGWGTYYQWGRKDPFAEGLYTYAENYDTGIQGSIRHPERFNSERSTYLTTYYYDWSTNNYDNLWDSQWNDYGVTSGNLPNHKTVMDPSPRKFCVSPDLAWDGFITYGHDGDFDSGYHFYTDSSKSKTIFFPATGIITHLGVLQKTTDNRYWTLHAWASAQRRTSYGLQFNSSTINNCHYSDNHRAIGQPVRPVMFN